MSTKKIIAVTGATGAQGGSVVEFLVNDGTFAVRAITRNTESEKAKALAKQGVEVVKADLKDLESIKRAFKGAYGVFGVTNFWEPGVGAEGEILQGKNLVDAAKSVGIKHFVWSTLDHTDAKAAHWESKADVSDYLKASGVPYTNLFTAFYLENLLQGSFFAVKKQEDGSYFFFLPMITDAPFAVYSVADTGAYTLAIFKDAKTWIGKDFLAVTDFITPRQIAKTFSDTVGKPIGIAEFDKAGFEGLKGGPVPEEILANNKALQDNPAPPFRDPVLSLSVHPARKSFKEWAQVNKEKLI